LSIFFVTRPNSSPVVCFSPYGNVSTMQRAGSGTWAASRKYSRFLIDMRLIVRTATALTLHGRTKNLGEGGMGATVAGDIPLGEFVELQFTAPQAPDPLVIRAEVRYRQGFQYGFKFIGLTEQQTVVIREAVRSLPMET
jgi:hypothetical protein